MSDTVQYRNECINRIKKYVPDKDQLSQIEKSILEYTIIEAKQAGIWKSWKNPAFTDIYIAKTRSILNNLDPSGEVGNTYLISLILKGQIDLKRIAFMEPVELFPDRSKALLDKFKEQENTLHYHKPTTSKAYTCGKCKKNTCLVQQYQSKSCDESATTAISCLHCGHRWVG
jgi:DNA-directed RNA polymerase subunit M/transcription elongation factor TFIIS